MSAPYGAGSFGQNLPWPGGALKVISSEPVNLYSRTPMTFADALFILGCLALVFRSPWRFRVLSLFIVAVIGLGIGG